MKDVTMRRSIKAQLAVSLIVPAMFLSSTVMAQDATPEAATDRATVAELEAALGPVPTPASSGRSAPSKRP